MWENGVTHQLVPGVLDEKDIQFLVASCRNQLETEHIPCFSLIDRLDSATVQKVKGAVEEAIGQEAFYLNDFYIYTDSSFKTSWHMDTELFSFDQAFNAWLLLSPDEVVNPLGFIKGLNETPDEFYHSVKPDGHELVFSNYHTRKKATKPLAEVEASQIHTPAVTKGDVLVINPGRFHKTNLSSPKHAVALKFVTKGQNGFLSSNQVHPLLWPEVKTFNGLVEGTADWEEVLDRTRAALQTEEGRTTLSSGFFPEQFGMYLERIRSI